jgi:hypothetical protein
VLQVMADAVRSHATGWRYLDTADMLRDWADRLDREMECLRGRLPDYRRDPDRDRHRDALDRLEIAHAALKLADVACGRVAKARGHVTSRTPATGEEDS